VRSYTSTVTVDFRRLVLFDIDGTLISTGGRAGRALAQALEQTFGLPVSIDGFPFAGKTDPRIAFELMELAGVPRSRVAASRDELFERYVRLLKDALPPGSVTVLPGVTAVLDELVVRQGVAVGLLTGNIAAGAEQKLRAAGLWSRFPFGAFGSDDEDRNHLVPIARARARELFGTEFPGAATVVVGDAEADVACARAGGAKAVAVASGWTARERLAAVGPDALFDSLIDPGVIDVLVQ
jgi:phosphoglycolate phosphatase